MFIPTKDHPENAPEELGVLERISLAVGLTKPSASTIRERIAMSTFVIGIMLSFWTFIGLGDLVEAISAGNIGLIVWRSIFLAAFGALIARLIVKNIKDRCFVRTMNAILTDAS